MTTRAPAPIAPAEDDRADQKLPPRPPTTATPTPAPPPKVVTWSSAKKIPAKAPEVAAPEAATAAKRQPANQATAARPAEPAPDTPARRAQARSSKRVGVMGRWAPPTAQADDEAIGELPPLPSRNDVARVMRSVRNEVQRCYDQTMVPGRVDLRLTVSGDTGRVTDSEVSADSSTADCIQEVAATLEFPRFAQNATTIHYPYTFR